MTKEEAIEICRKIIEQNKEIVKQTRKNNDINAMQLTANCDNESIAIETILNLIQTQQEEIKCLKQAGEATEKVYKAQLEKKDKIIDEMAKELGKQFSSYEPCYLDNEIKQEEYTRYKNCQDCIKQYFEKKVEGKQC